MGLLDREHGSLPPETSILLVSRTSFSFSLRKETTTQLSRTQNPGPWTLDPGPRTLDPGPWTLVRDRLTRLVLVDGHWEEGLAAW